MNNIRNKISFFLITSAIVPATLLLILSLIGIFIILLNFETKESHILLSMLLGILGYAGLIMLLFLNQSKKQLKTNIFLLICGITGFIIFTSFNGGIEAWKWILTFEEIDEWFIYVWPNIVAIIFIIVQLIKINKYEL